MKIVGHIKNAYHLAYVKAKSLYVVYLNVILFLRVRTFSRRTFMRVRKKLASGEKIRVLFLVSETSKWKAQSLFNAMACSDRFEPVIGLLPPDYRDFQPPERTQSDYQKNVQFFLRKKMRYVDLYDPVLDTPLDISRCCPDIVFYQQAAFHVPSQLPDVVERFALTAYIPYFTPNHFSGGETECSMRNHHIFDYHFVLNEKMAANYGSLTKYGFYNGKFVGSGHTILDEIKFSANVDSACNSVIYAPHFTIDSPLVTSRFRYSTFLWNGYEILVYAEAHKEVQWIFKPHPALRITLLKCGVMAEHDIAEYYARWAKIGRVETSGDYITAFNESFAMITDCGSFLTEYGATGKPIIHLISSLNNMPYDKAVENVYRTYYDVHNIEELRSMLRLVIEQRKDPKREERHAEIRKAKLSGNNAAANIIAFLEKELSR